MANKKLPSSDWKKLLRFFGFFCKPMFVPICNITQCIIYFRPDTIDNMDAYSRALIFSTAGLDVSKNRKLATRTSIVPSTRRDRQRKDSHHPGSQPRSQPRSQPQPRSQQHHPQTQRRMLVKYPSPARYEYGHRTWWDPEEEEGAMQLQHLILSLG